MKILITTECYTPAVNGVVISILTLQKELLKMGHEVRILTLSNGSPSFTEGNVTYIRAMNIGRIYPDARYALFYRNKYIRELIEWHPDLIHSQSEFSTFRIAVYISKKLEVPIVHTYHTIYEEYTHYFSPNKKLGKDMAMRFTRRILNQTQFVIAPSEKVHTILNGYGVRQKIKVVPTGIDLEKFDAVRNAPELRKLREKIGIQDGQKVLITVSRLGKEKNLDEILLFISRLNNPGITLLAIGDGPYRENLEEYARKLNIAGRVIFAGMVEPSEIASYYMLGDVYVCASNSETQGLTYMEALAAGVPALCKKDPCLNNVIVDGVNGWQYSTYDEFAARLNEMFSQDKLYERLCENAHMGIVRDYSSAAFARKVLLIYKEALCQSQSARTVSRLNP